MKAELLEDLKSYFENKADADHEGESYRPNAEMRFFSQLVEYDEYRSDTLQKIAIYFGYKSFEEMDPRVKILIQKL